MQRLCVIILIKKNLDSDSTVFDYSNLNCSNVHKYVNVYILIDLINYYYIGIYY